jgi:hypothetical protein
MLPDMAVAMVASALLVQAPAGMAESLAGIYGRTLGAAAQCTEIDRKRLDAVAELASAHVKALAQGPAEAASAGKTLADAMARGSGEVQSGLVTCAQAESELDNLERDLQSDRALAPPPRGPAPKPETASPD